MPVTNPAVTFEAFTQAESDQMEAVFQHLSAEAQTNCLALNPSPEDIAFAAAEKLARDKAKEAERKRNKEVIVEVKEEAVAEADESDPYADGAELEDRAPESADEIEAAEAEVGVAIGKVQSSRRHIAPPEAFVDLRDLILPDRTGSLRSQCRT